jgi:hypothetical protein
MALSGNKVPENKTAVPLGSFLIAGGKLSGINSCWSDCNRYWTHPREQMYHLMMPEEYALAFGESAVSFVQANWNSKKKNSNLRITGLFFL